MRALLSTVCGPAMGRWLATAMALSAMAQNPSAILSKTPLEAPRLFSAEASYMEIGRRSPIFQFTGSWSGVAYDEGAIRAGGIIERIPDGVDYAKGKFSLTALPDKTLKPGSGTMVVLAINDTESTQVLYTGDRSTIGGVQFHQEACVESNSWKLLEYYPSKKSGFCGNDSTSISIPSHACLAFSARRYKGSTKAKLRVVIHKSQGSLNEDMVSNEFTGSINPGQFSMGYDYANFVLGKWDQFPKPPDDAFTLPKLVEAPKLPQSMFGTWKEWGLPPLHRIPWSIEVGEDPAPPQLRKIKVSVTIDEHGRVLEAHVEDPALMWTEEIPRACGWAVSTSISRGRFLPATVDGHPVASTGDFDDSSAPGQCTLAFRPAAFLGPHPGIRGFRNVRDEASLCWHVLIGHTGAVFQVTPVGARYAVDEKRLSESRGRLKSLKFAPATINGSPIPFECLLVEDPLVK